MKNNIFFFLSIYFLWKKAIKINDTHHRTIKFIFNSFIVLKEIFPFHGFLNKKNLNFVSFFLFFFYLQIHGIFIIPVITTLSDDN